MNECNDLLLTYLSSSSDISCFSCLSVSPPACFRYLCSLSQRVRMYKCYSSVGGYQLSLLNVRLGERGRVSQSVDYFSVDCFGYRSVFAILRRLSAAAWIHGKILLRSFTVLESHI
jgi:hypothetical protein